VCNWATLWWNSTDRLLWIFSVYRHKANYSWLKLHQGKCLLHGTFIESDVEKGVQCVCVCVCVCEPVISVNTNSQQYRTWGNISSLDCVSAVAFTTCNTRAAEGWQWYRNVTRMRIQDVIFCLQILRWCNMLVWNSGLSYVGQAKGFWQRCIVIDVTDGWALSIISGWKPHSV
jgi:hypothetical protein